MEQVDKLLDRRFVTLQMPFDATIGRIAHPAPNSEPICLFCGPGTEKHTLNEAGHPNVEAYLRHQTTLMSGASSAFMPTTL